MPLENLMWIEWVLGALLVATSAVAFYLTHYRLKSITGPVVRVLWTIMLIITCIVAMDGFSAILMAYYHSYRGSVDPLTLTFESIEHSFILVAIVTSIYIIRSASLVFPSINIGELDPRRLSRVSGESPKLRSLRVISKHLSESSKNLEALAYEIGKVEAVELVKTKVKPSTNLWDLVKAISEETGIKSELQVESGLRVLRFLVSRELRDEGSLPLIIYYFKGLWEGLASAVLSKPVIANPSIVPVKDGILVEITF